MPVIKRKKSIKRRRSAYVTKTVRAHPQKRKAVSLEEFNELQDLLFNLQQLSQKLVSEINVERILDQIMSTLGSVLKAVWVNIWELTPDGKAAYIKQGSGKRKGMEAYIEHSRKNPLKIGTAWIGRALLTKRTWSTSDLFTDPHLPRSWVAPVKAQGFHAIVCTPQIVESAKVIGGMCVYFDKPKIFTDFEMRLISVAANQAAVAMVNAKIYDDLVSERNKTLKMIESLNEGIILYDNEHQVILINPKARELLWITGEEIIGKQITEDIARQSIFLKNVFTISQLAQAEYETREYTTEGPHQVVLEVTLLPVRDALQKIGSMQILRDISREKELDLVKSNFIATASHQLRTPLTGVNWALESLKRGEIGALTAIQQELVEKTSNAVMHSIALINDLLNASRIEEGKLGYAFKEQDIIPFMRRIITEHAIAIEQQKVTITFTEPQKPLPKISIDDEKFSLAVNNILDNAIRYSSAGKKITIAFTITPIHMVLHITDEGIGIPKEDQKFIFIKFFRAKNATHFQTEGSGLGLYIAKNIVEKHNGKISFESTENVGSTFFIHLPITSQKMPRSIETAQ